MRSGTRHTQINVPVNPSDVPPTLARPRSAPNQKPASTPRRSRTGFRNDSLSRTHVTTFLKK
jgi:hypothetical protein